MNINKTPLWVSTNTHRYPIILTTQFQGDLDFREYLVGKQVLIVTNEAIKALFLDMLCQLLDGFEVAVCVLPDGEQYKTQDSINQIYDLLLKQRFSRDCTLIALGGGVIGDMTGFAAASFMRGVNFIQIPTTLLAQVDSSVGGKTGINHPLGKNMIGAFWQPVCVVADMGVLATLPYKEFCAGMAEVIKYGLIMDKAFLDWLWDNQQAIINKDHHALSVMVRQCCAYKADIVAKDEKEQGERAWLNFGHTFGHAIEAQAGYGNWLHGEAVAVGMVQASCLSYALGYLQKSDIKQILDLLTAFHLPVVPPSCPTNDLFALMSRDKKVQSGKLRFVILTKIGQANIRGDLPSPLIKAILDLPYKALAEGDFTVLDTLTLQGYKQ